MPEHAIPARYWGDREPQANFRGLDVAVDAPSTAELRLYDPIDSWGAPFGVSAKDFSSALDALPADTSTITLRINSPGGEVGDSLAILNALRAHKADVDVIVEGRACSGASVIAMAGKTITMARQSQMMIHDAAGIGIGNATEMADYAAFLEKSSDNIAAVYAERAGGTPADWREVMRAETWFNDDEAVAAKLADKVAPKTTAPKAALNRFDLAIFNYAGREAAPDPKTPADQPVNPTTDHKEADTMSDTIPTAGLVKALGLADDADEETILEAVDAKVKADAALAKAQADLKTAQDAATAPTKLPEGVVTVSQAKLDALTAQADLGAKAHARQISDDRTALIDEAVETGRINNSKDTRTVWEREFARDFDTAKADLDSLPARFPIGTAPGRAGTESDAQASYTNEMAAEDAQFFGVPQEVLAR